MACPTNRASSSPHGEAIKPDLLHVRAAEYSEQNRQVEMIKDEKGMRSKVSDAQLMLSLPSRRVAQRIGVLEENDGIDCQNEPTRLYTISFRTGVTVCYT